jgi:hypothetical protein
VTPLLGLSRNAVTRPDGSVLNTCPAAVLAEILRFLKRCYWPFAWDTAPAAGGGAAADGSGALANGGFANAAQARLILRTGVTDRRVHLIQMHASARQ